MTRNYYYAPLWPEYAIKAAIQAESPTLLVPCDERARQHLHAIHETEAPGSSVAALIRRSIGAQDGFAVALQRTQILVRAAEAGVRVAPMVSIETASDLRSAADKFGFPLVLKQDGSWGGMGVKLARDLPEAESIFGLLTFPLNSTQVVKHLLAEGDPFWIRPWLSATKPRIGAQRYIEGRAANSVVACWEGEVLADLHVEVLQMTHPLGPSAIVKVIENADMKNTAVALVRSLSASGFFGFDFIIEEDTGFPYLIEVNPRCTPTTHLCLEGRRDPVLALASRASGCTLPPQRPVTKNPVIAHFPQAWLHDDPSEMLDAAFHDVPWEDPAYLLHLVRQADQKRGLWSRFIAALRHRTKSAALSEKSPPRGREAETSTRKVRPHD